MSRETIFKPAWFLEIDLVRASVCVSVCPPPRALITSGMIWCDIGREQLVKQVSQLSLLLMTLAVDKMDGCGHINTACQERLPKKTKVMRYWLQKDYQKDRVLHLCEWANTWRYI